MVQERLKALTSLLVVVAKLKNDIARNFILGLESKLKTLPKSIPADKMQEIYNDHLFAPGLYCRQMRIPQGMCIVGKIHKHSHINVITKGEIKVVTEFDSDTYTAPKIWISEPGTKRAVYALTDTEWMTVHANPDNITDIDALVDLLTVSNYDSLDLLIDKGELQ